MSTMTQTTNICWFEIPADNLDRAKKFYGSLFGWKIEPFQGMAGGEEYLHIDTGGGDDTPDGGLMKRKQEQPKGITNYIKVESVTDSARQVEKLGGKVHMGKTAVPQMGWFAVCQDPEGNVFGLWEMDRNAK